MIALLRILWIRILIKFHSYNTVYKVYSKYYNVKIGKNVRFTGRPNFGSEPFLIEIGDNVTITDNVSFFTHDGGLWVLRNELPDLNYFGRIIIGNNVFIGAGSKIRYDVKIGNNVVIGLGLVVTRSIPDNSVAVGNPARVVSTIEEYKKRSLAKNYLIINESNLSKRKDLIINHLENFKKL